MPRSSHEEYWASGHPPMNLREGETLQEAQDIIREVAMFVDARSVSSIIDFGAGTGRFLHAASEQFGVLDLAGVEINEVAARVLGELRAEVYVGSIVDYPGTDAPYDLAMAMGVLACVPPRLFPRALRTLYAASRRYVLIYDYFAPGEPEELPYGPSSLFYRNYKNVIGPGFRIVAGSEAPTGREPRWFLFERAVPGSTLRP